MTEVPKINRNMRPIKSPEGNTKCLLLRNSALGKAFSQGLTGAEGAMGVMGEGHP